MRGSESDISRMSISNEYEMTLVNNLHLIDCCVPSNVLRIIRCLCVFVLRSSGSQIHRFNTSTVQ